MSGGRAPRAKGNRAERAIVRYLQDRGLAAERVPLSGSAGGSYAGDVTIPCIGRDLCAEVKVRGSGFRRLYDWLAGRDLLIVRADRREPLVILPLRLAAEIAAAAERGKAVRPRECDRRVDIGPAPTLSAGRLRGDSPADESGDAPA